MLNAGDGGFHMSAYTICLSKKPFFDAYLTPNDPVFHFSPHPMTPFFFKISNTKFWIFCTLYQFSAKYGKVSLKFDQILQQMIPNFGKFTPKRPNLGEFHTQRPPFFLRTPTQNTLCFRSLVGTYPSLSYLSSPSPRVDCSFFAEKQNWVKTIWFLEWFPSPCSLQEKTWFGSLDVNALLPQSETNQTWNPYRNMI